MRDLKVGVGREIITPKIGAVLRGYLPPRKAEAVNDDLTVTAVLFDFCGEQSLLMSATVCLIDLDLIDLVRGRISNETGINEGNIIIAATHTHSGPTLEGQYRDQDYIETVFIPKCVKAAQAALSGLQNAVMGIGTAQSDIGINRRQINEDGSISLGQNPWGYYDPTMTVIAFKTEEGKPLANIIHYCAHCTGAGINKEITRDWPGPMIDRLEKETGAVSMFIAGAEGDVGPRLSNGLTAGKIVTENNVRFDISFALELGAKAAFDAVKAYKSIKDYAKADMQVLAEDIKLPYEPFIPLEKAKEEYEKYPEDATDWNFVYKNHYKGIIEAYETGKSIKTHLILKQTLIKLGSLVFVPFPFEMFVEMTLRLREYSPFQHTLCLSNANGNYSYFPTHDQICRGGYEVTTFKMMNVYPLADDADNDMVSENLRLIKAIKEI